MSNGTYSLIATEHLDFAPAMSSEREEPTNYDIAHSMTHKTIKGCDELYSKIEFSAKTVKLGDMSGVQGTKDSVDSNVILAPSRHLVPL